MEPTLTRHLHHLPFADLEAYITIYHGPDDEIVKGDAAQPDGRRQTDARIARFTLVERYTVLRWRKQGLLSNVQADRAAIGLGVNPACIWPQWGDDIDSQSVVDDKTWQQQETDRRTQLRTIRKQQRQELSA
jgi:hypothetical protein